MKNKKESGIEGITAKIFKAMKEFGVDIIHVLYSKIWKMGKWTKGCCELVFISIQKAGLIDKLQ